MLKHLRIELAAALAGGVISTAAGVMMHSFGLFPHLSQIWADAVTQVLSPETFHALLERFGTLGKPLVYAQGIVAQTLVCAVGLMLASRVRLPGFTSHPAARIAVDSVLAGGTLGVFVGATAALAKDSSPCSQPLIYAISLPVIGLVAAVSANAALFAAGSPATGQSTVVLDPARRRLLKAAVLSLSAISGLSLTERIYDHVKHRPHTPKVDGLQPEVTPNNDFYIVSKNVDDPQLSANGWALRVGGRVSNAFQLSLTDLQALPAVEEYVTLQCISNDIGGPYIGNALWKGIPLEAIMDMAKPLPGASVVIFTSQDDYVESVPLSNSSSQKLILAYSMNGQPLPPEHGFPLRLINPGKYGMKNPKWLKEIALSETRVEGYWEERGWSSGALMSTTTRVDAPRSFDRLPLAPVLFQGIALAGDRGIQSVQVSVDDGTTWSEASIKTPPSRFTWVLWTYEWRPTSAGLYKVLARAIDGKGEVQTAVRKLPGPEGATGQPRLFLHINES